MKNYINFKTAHLGLFILLSFLGWGCQNDDIRTLSPQTINAEEQIEVKDPDVEDGILIFQTRSHFESILAEHKAWDDDQRLAWEEEIGFTSQYSQLMKILDAEESSENAYYQAHLDAGVSMEEIFSDSLPKPPHSSIYLKAMEEGWIVIHEDSDTANVYSPNSPIPYCTLLGLEGFIKIGDTLSHYTRNQMKHWVGGQIENRDLLHRMNQTRLEEGILVSDGGRSNLTRVNNDWGTESFFFRWVVGSSGKHRGAYQLRGWATDYGISEPTSIWVEHWFELYAQKKNVWGNWKAVRSYRPDFHLAGSWSTEYGLASLGSTPCTISSTLRTNWCNNNTLHNTSLISPISLVIPADNTTYQFEYLYPRGRFETDCDQEWFCGLYRSVFVDVNVHINGDGGGNIDLGRHIYSE